MSESKKKLKNTLNTELDAISIYTKSIEEGPEKERIEHLLHWYTRKADFYRKAFYGFNMAVIIINAIIPVFTQMTWKDKDIIISIMSAAATIITSCLALFTMKDTWFRYRSSVENMKTECIKFAYKIGDYAQDDESLDKEIDENLDEEAKKDLREKLKQELNEKLLVRNIEQIVVEERTLWQETQFNNNDN